MSAVMIPDEVISIIAVMKEVVLDEVRSLREQLALAVEAADSIGQHAREVEEENERLRATLKRITDYIDEWRENDERWCLSINETLDIMEWCQEAIDPDTKKPRP
jgi:hypothetical protein